ncbi:MAG: GGDEF domain-containing protein [Treponema sp.]|jgi:diguanylate cyclase (GGDEF)-like protein|nr:GGDEF domain-containing protein [Treponema sp.]
MSNLLSNNLFSLRQVNIIIAIFMGSFALYPIFFEKSLFTAGICLLSILIALLLAFYANFKVQTSQVSDRFIYVLTIISYANVILFGIYLGVWADPDKFASIFYCFLICALLMFIYPPYFILFLTVGAMVVYIITTVLVKRSTDVLWDVINTMIVGVLSLYFNWHISKLRIGLELSAIMLEDERNRYFDQSTVDELTKCKNRRDFMATFQRYLSNYRTSDDWICISICDIDFFKNYNDHYGHPMGDECLRSVGRVLNSLMDNMGVYAARVGGEEFALLWFEKDASHADTVISDIANSINNLKIQHEKSKVSPYVSLSIGVYVLRCGASHDTKALYDLADKALYAAKGGGRNCAVISGNEITKEYKISFSTANNE